MAKRKIVSAVCTALCLCCAAELKAAEKETFQKFLTECELTSKDADDLSQSQQYDAISCVSTIKGMIAIMQANCFLRSSEFRPHDFLSMQSEATVGQALQAILSYSREHIDEWQKDWRWVATHAIADKLPCKK